MAEPFIGWTSQEAWIFIELARRGLVASLDGSPPQRAGTEEPGRFRAEVRASQDDLVLELHLDAERAELSLRPLDDDEHRFRDGWVIAIERGDERWILAPGGPPVTIDDARYALLVGQLRSRSLHLVRALDGLDEILPVSDVAFHRYTRQSTRAARTAHSDALPPWMEPTEPEVAPWWEIDLGRGVFVDSLRADLVAVPVGARLEIAAFAYPTRRGEPPPGSFTAAAEPGARGDDGRLTLSLVVGVVVRYVRVTLVAPAGETAALAVRALEVLAVEPFADDLRSTLRRSFAFHGDRPLILARATEEDPYLPTHTYRDVWSQSMALGRSLAARLEGAATEPVVLALMTRNRTEWILADLAAVARGYVVVPISPEDADDRLAQILARAKPAGVVCEARDVARLCALGASIRLLAVCDASDDEARAWAPASPGATCVRFEDLVREGTSLVVPAPAPRANDDLFSVIFTSGSTGAPKGAMRTYGSFHEIQAGYGLEQGNRHLSFQPLSHVSERMFLPSLLIQGGVLAFSRGGAHLLRELRAFEPTQLGSVPRLFEVLHAGYRRSLRAAVAAAPEAPLAGLSSAALRSAREAFGGRLRALSIGSAPVSAEVLAFLRRCFEDLWVNEGYGSTELETIAVDGRVMDGVEVKLVPLAGAPPAAPGEPERGALWVRTRHVISGYLGDPEATRASLDEEGFFATGDLVERDAHGVVRVVGRLGNTVKLAQGEFVSAERIEAVLGGAPIVDRLFVLASHGAPGVSALVVPQRDALARLLDAPPDAPLDLLTARADAPAAVLGALRAHGRREGLAGWEAPRGVLLEAAPFTLAGGLLTASGKLARGALAERYGARLAALATGEAEAETEVELDGGDLIARVTRVAARVLGRAVDPRAPLSESGGVDSLAATELMAALADDLGREVPLALWFEAQTLEDLAARLDSFRTAAPSRALAERVAADRRPAPSRAPAPPALPLRTLLLTGATGFLGAHLVEALLARTDLRILCLVRAGDDAAAERRLADTLASYDLPIAPSPRLRALAGDLAAPRLGLTEAAYLAVAEETDAILHAGASVSWLASYEALRGPNVLGTQALLDLAHLGRARPFHFVSTISVAPADGDEDTTLSLAAARAGSPYGLSKWIAEEHVRAAGHAGLPVAVYRPGMIAGSTGRGHGNPDDFIHRYLVGVADLGLYLDLEDARLDMTPVDFVAAAIVALLTAHPLGGATHHLVNVDQSLSYAALGRALRSAGLPVAPASYAAFRAALDRARGSRLHALAAFFPEAGFALDMAPWPGARTTAAVAALGVQRPAVDEALIGRYVASLVQRGRLRIPG